MRDLKAVTKDLLDLVEEFYETHGYIPVVEAYNYRFGYANFYVIEILGETGYYNHVYIDVKVENSKDIWIAY